MKIPAVSSLATWREARQLVRISRTRVIFMSVMGAIVGVSESLFLAILARLALAITRGGTNGSVDLPFGLLSGVGVPATMLIALALALASAGVQLALQSQLAHVSVRSLAQSQVDLYHDFLRASWPLQRGDGESTLVTYASMHVARTVTAVTSIITQMTSLITLVVFVIGAVSIAPVVGAIVIVLGLILYFVFTPLRGLSRRAGDETREATGILYSSFVDAVAVGREIKSFGVEDAIETRIKREVRAFVKPAYRTLIIRYFLPVAYQRVVFLLVLGGLGIVYALDVDDIASIGGAMLIVLRAMQQAQSIQSVEPVIAEARSWISELIEQRAKYRASELSFGTTTLSAVDDIAFENVSYRYADDAPWALDNVSFSMRRGELIGVIGPSGSGKSTLSELVLRLDRPTQGTYRVNGDDAWEIAKDGWADNVVLVPQMGRLIPATVADNVRFFRPGISDEEVRWACERVRLSDEIAALEDGFDTMIGERRYRMLSGGQRQRLSIARALVGKASLVVLDEPTSALDHRSEEAIIDAVEELRTHACVIVIAHRLSTLRHCDRVLVLRDGKAEALCELKDLADQSEFFRGAQSTGTF